MDVCSATSLRMRRGRRPATAAALLTLVVIATLAAWAPTSAAAAPISAYRGLGAWVDLYDARAWDDPAACARDLARHHVRTLFIETSNYHWPTDINRGAALGAIIRQCHARDIKVVAWYLPGLTHPDVDYRRSMAAIRFRTPGGQRFDSFALDIEASLVHDVDVRNRRLSILSRRIRAAVGDRYPLGGIIPSPAGMRLHPTFWPRFPYKMVANRYDVIVPMGYYTYHGNSYANAYNDTRNNALIIREKTERPDVPIHIIAGLGAASSAAETQAYVRALRETGCLGGSMYDWPTTGAEDWRQLANVRANPRQTVALPVDVGYLEPLGNCPADHSHPKEVFYQAPAQVGAVTLQFRLYDAGADEIRLFVNWHDLGTLDAGPGGDWSDVLSREIPADALFTGKRNVIAFVAAGRYPHWHTWGVRGVIFATP